MFNTIMFSTWSLGSLKINSTIAAINDHIWNTITDYWNFVSWRSLQLSQSRSLFLSNDVTIVHSDRMKTRLLNIEWNMFLYVAIQPLWCHSNMVHSNKHSNFIMSFKLYGAIQTSWYHSNFLVLFKLSGTIQTLCCHSDWVVPFIHTNMVPYRFLVPFRLHGSI